MKKTLVISLLVIGSLCASKEVLAVECNDDMRALLKVVEELDQECKMGDKDACKAYEMIDPKLKKIVCDE